MGVITFNNKTSTTYNINVERPPRYVIAEADYDTVDIPGRSGDLYYSTKKTFKNVPRSYDISFYNGNGKMEEIASAIHEFLHSANGYARLEDTYDPYVFRLAYYVRRLDLENILFKAGRGKIEFSCKPQRFLKTGEVAVVFTTDGTLSNPTINDASPIIRIYGSGVVWIGSQSITVASSAELPEYIDVDCELMDAYHGTDNCNSFVTFGSYDEITLHKLSNSIALRDGITRVEITPRWWIL